MSLRLNNPASVISGTPGDYSADERALLLRAAHLAIERALRGEELDIAAPSPHLAELRADFTPSLCIPCIGRCWRRQWRQHTVIAASGR
jgi:hypothetical protein